MKAISPLRTLLFLALFFIAFESLSQEIPALESFNQTRLDYNQKGMLILGSWAVGNMIWGGIGASQSNGCSKWN